MKTRNAGSGAAYRDMRASYPLRGGNAARSARAPPGRPRGACRPRARRRARGGGGRPRASSPEWALELVGARAAATASTPGAASVILGAMTPVPPARHLLRAKDLIDRRYRDPLDVEALAQAAHLSRAHFSREFRRALRHAP